MHILYIHQYYKTPEEGGCIRSFHIAKGMAKAGHQVTVISGADFQRIEKVGSVEIRYLKVAYRNEFGFLRRIWAFLQFVFKAKHEIRKLPQADLAYVVTTPLTSGLLALHLKKKYGIPYVFEVGDLWPEAPIQMGALKNKFLIKALRAFEKRCYDQAHKVVALSPPIAEHILKTSPLSAVEVIPNFSDIAFFNSNQNTSSPVFNIGYFGTFGRANRLGSILDLAANCERDELPVAFHLMGDGAERSLLIEKAKNLKSVTFYPAGSQSEVRDRMTGMDAILVSFDPEVPILNTGSPNKFFDGLAAGKVIIINLNGWIKSLVETHECGFYYGNYKDFKEKLVVLLSDTTKVSESQRNALKLASEFEVSTQVDKLIRFVVE